MRCLLIIACFLLAPFAIHAQSIRPYDVEMQAQHALLKGYDPAYRVNYFENIILRTTLTSEVSRLQFSNSQTGETVSLSPVAQYQLGFSFDYKWVALGVSFTPDFLLDTRDFQELENSKSLQIKLNFFYSDQWRQELSYSFYEGFFDRNATIPVEGNEQPYINTTLKTIQGSTFYIANKNYSFRAHFAQTERQLKSAGSLIPRIRYAYSLIKPNTGDNMSAGDISQITSLDIFAQTGYLYTYVLREKWFATAGIHPGIGYSHSGYDYPEDTSPSKIFDTVSLAVLGELSIGYNSYRWFFGTTLNWRNYNYANNQDVSLTSDSFYAGFHLGYRFNDNKPMRKFFGWFEDHFGF